MSLHPIPAAAHSVATTRESVNQRESDALSAFNDRLAVVQYWHRRTWREPDPAKAIKARAKALEFAEISVSEALRRTLSPTGHYCAVTVRRPEAGGTGVRVVTG